ncbi:MAG: TetR/AcrR family transcriptional regulator [Tissierellales bacterium]|nr:TetR/AcrR family transcriptional regulator [Tissierellales bacterium]
MPKIIKNVKDKIIYSATKRFETLEYDQVDMKSIALDANIAVGTLYNYYSNKKDIFNAVFDNSWEETIKNVARINYVRGHEIEFVRKSLEKIYDDMFDKKHMISQYLTVNSNALEMQLREDLHFEEEKSDNVIRRKLLLQIENQIKEWNEIGIVNIDEGMEVRFVGILFMDIWSLIVAFPEEREKNLLFLNKLVKNMLF